MQAAQVFQGKEVMFATDSQIANGGNEASGRKNMVIQMWHNVNVWGIWVKGIQEFFVVFLKFFCKPELFQN